MQLENKNKQIKIGMVLNYLSMVVEGLVIFLLNPFIIRALGQADYGVYSLITSFSGYLSIFDFGLGTAIIRYIAKYNAENKEKEKENFLSFSFFIYFLISVVITVVAIILYNCIDRIFSASLTFEQINLAKQLFIIIATSMTITTLGSIFSAIISGYEKFIFTRTVVLLCSIINVILTILVLATKATAVKLTYITLITTLITFITNVIYVFFKLKIKVKFHNWDSKLFKEVFKFSIFVFLQTLISQIYWRLDQLIIGIEIIDAAIPLAIYAVAMRINDLVLAFTTVINRYQLPSITRLAIIEKDEDKLIKYIGKTSKFVAVLYFAIIIGFIFFGEKFINVYAGEGYELAYPIVLIVIIASSLNRIHGCGSDVLKAKNKNGMYTVIIFITAILNIALTIILIPVLGLIGAAIGTAVSVVLGNTIAYYWCLYKQANINIKLLFIYTFKGFLKPVIISVIAALLINLISNTNIYVYILKLFMFAMVYCITVYKWILDEEEKLKIKKVLLRGR